MLVISPQSQLSKNKSFTSTQLSPEGQYKIAEEKFKMIIIPPQKTYRCDS
jgi:hypothetical protein